ncbi:MAG: hypothetical protein Q7T49_02890, partial [bacterium]|nr:hypothetical protein [bacterium]
MPPDQNNNEARERARQALSGGRVSPPNLKPKIGAEVTLNLPPAEVAKQRDNARASMEGYERRERRKALERQQTAERAIQQKLATDLAAKRRAAEEAARAKERAAAEAE